ncbi:hypothetical protein SJ05684_c37020 [Sinorhizobium sojae CCBAU 05684]|uniref:Uncharacterized protein n=1 Tax=Sinorhizobium sojae CCBAU 05684 TaxID=716928 RepID=A0A249PH64_9HYPH|nr:hypothetical protein SJ05684_c37020 [Sinorhizobium sojae CCBAU 05684]
MIGANPRLTVSTSGNSGIAVILYPLFIPSDYMHSHHGSDDL